MNELLLRPNDKIVFIGDSITDCGRRGEPHAPYGAGYVAMVRNLLIARYPELNLIIENRGIGGNTVRDLKARWEVDALALQPDVLSVKIGINDVWRTVANRPTEAVPKTEYEATYRELLQAARKRTTARLVLMEPYVIETNRSDLFRRLIDEYCPVVHKLAREFDAVLVRTQVAFDDVLAKQPATFWASDRVHPNAPGHMVIARAWLQATGFTW